MSSVDGSSGGGKRKSEGPPIRGSFAKCRQSLPWVGDTEHGPALKQQRGCKCIQGEKMNRQEKDQQVNELTELFDGAQLMVITEYAGMSPIWSSSAPSFVPPRRLSDRQKHIGKACAEGP